MSIRTTSTPRSLSSWKVCGTARDVAVWTWIWTRRRRWQPLMLASSCQDKRCPRLILRSSRDWYSCSFRAVSLHMRKSITTWNWWRCVPEGWRISLSNCSNTASGLSKTMLPCFGRCRKQSMRNSADNVVRIVSWTTGACLWQHLKYCKMWCPPCHTIRFFKSSSKAFANKVRSVRRMANWAAFGTLCSIWRVKAYW